MIQILQQRGIHLPDHRLWLDPRDPKDCAFVSHAHADHIAPHDHLLATPETLQFLQLRLPGTRRHTPLPFFTPLRHHLATLQLLPAGHIAGSAQLHLQDDHSSLLYTGDFSLRPNPSCEPAQSLTAETLVMETTFGLPHYKFPPTQQILDQILAFCSTALADGCVPVLLAYPLGKSQEIFCTLAAAGLPTMLHPTTFALTEVYRRVAPSFPTTYRKFLASDVQGHVLISPPSSARSHFLSRIRRTRTAILTGWAIDPGAQFRYGTDAAFPLSDHADYPDLLRYVEQVQPKRVLTTHGFASEFAADLRRRGIEAWALQGENQLELHFGWPHPHSTPKSQKSAPPPNPTSHTPSQFFLLAHCAEKIRELSSRTAKLKLLASYLSQLPDLELGTAALFLSGRAFPQHDPRTLQTGWSLVRRSLLAASGLCEARLREISSRLRDPGPIALEALRNLQTAPRFSLSDASAFFEKLASATGSHKRAELLTATFHQIDPLESSYLVRILTGELRIGLGESLVEEALALAFHRPATEIRRAQMLLGDLAETARCARIGSLADTTLQIFHPFQCMLAHPEPRPDTAWQRIQTSSQPTHWRAEPKLDGIRAQFHVRPPQAQLFSRDLRHISDQFPELIEKAPHFKTDAVLDGEIVAPIKDGRFSFAHLQKRLGKKEPQDWFSQPTPVIFCAFDLLHLDGRSLLNLPFHERRAQLENLPLPGNFQLLPSQLIHSEDHLRHIFRSAHDAGHEGLILKDGSSLYSPGQRGLEWLKLKHAPGTLDVVVVAAQQGHGRRSHLLSDLTFAVRNSNTLLPIGKAYSGLTHSELEELTAHFRSTTIKVRGSTHEVLPTIVLEVAFDSLQPSTRHASGLAMRFPRIKTIRKDKTPSEIDTIQSARLLAGLPANPTTP